MLNTPNPLKPCSQEWCSSPVITFMALPFQQWSLLLDSAFHVRLEFIAQLEENNFWLYTNSFAHPCIEHQGCSLQASDSSADKGRSRQDKTRQAKSQARVWIDMGSWSQPPLPPSVFQGAAQQPLCRFPFCLSCGSQSLKLLAAVIIFLRFLKLHISLFKYSIWFKYLENANFLYLHMTEKNPLTAVFPG